MPSTLPEPASADVSISRKLLNLAVPIIGINTLQVLMLVVDSALCGRLPNPEPVLAALGYAVQLIWLLLVAMLGLLVGTVALVARAHGAKNTSRVDHIVEQSTMLTAIFGVVVGALGAIFAVPLMRMIGASPAIADLGAEYLRPLMLGTPFSYLVVLYTGILRGVGNTRVPFLCAIVANIINVVLNYGLVLGHFGLPQIGIAGSAVATVCAQMVNLAILIVVLRRGAVPGMVLRLRKVPLDRALARDLIKIGWPAGVDFLVINAGFLTVIGLLGYIDEVTVAAHGLGMRVQSLAFVPGMSISQATGALVGMALGAGDAERAKSVLRSSIKLCLAVMTGLGLVIFITAEAILAVFDVPSGTPLADYAVMWMHLLGYAMVPSAVHVACVGLLQGSGATRTSLKINIVSSLAVQVPLAAILGLGLDLGAFGVWLSIPLSAVLRAAWAYQAYRSGKWAVTGVRVGGGAPAPAKS